MVFHLEIWPLWLPQKLIVNKSVLIFINGQKEIASRMILMLINFENFEKIVSEMKPNLGPVL